MPHNTIFLSLAELAIVMGLSSATIQKSLEQNSYLLDQYPAYKWSVLDTETGKLMGFNVPLIHINEIIKEQAENEFKGKSLSELEDAAFILLRLIQNLLSRREGICASIRTVRLNEQQKNQLSLL